MKIINSYLVKTEYGICMLAMTDTNEWFKLTHHSLSYDGGGTMSWDTVTQKEADFLLAQYRITNKNK